MGTAAEKEIGSQSELKTYLTVDRENKDCESVA
jgi:hypothetical protein